MAKSHETYKCTHTNGPSAWGKGSVMSMLPIWTENGKSMVILQRLDTICAEVTNKVVFHTGVKRSVGTVNNPNIKKNGRRECTFFCCFSGCWTAGWRGGWHPPKRLLLLSVVWRAQLAFLATLRSTMSKAIYIPWRVNSSVTAKSCSEFKKWNTVGEVAIPWSCLFSAIKTFKRIT